MASAPHYDDFWISHLGTGIIADAFRWAHQADPRALLFYNDYNDEGINSKSDATYAFVRQLLAQGVPINGVGLQLHLDVQYPFPDQMPQNMQRFAELGMKLAVTEADVRIPLPVDATKQLAQNADYVQSLQACLAVRARRDPAADPAGMRLPCGGLTGDNGGVGTHPSSLPRGIPLPSLRA